MTRTSQTTFHEGNKEDEFVSGIGKEGKKKWAVLEIVEWKNGFERVSEKRGKNRNGK